jgi:hypothetical protein
VCDKQYKSSAEMEEHLSSYDHHHTKRLREMKRAELERTRDARTRKEQRRAAREEERLLKQCGAPSCAVAWRRSAACAPTAVMPQRHDSTARPGHLSATSGQSVCACAGLRRQGLVAGQGLSAKRRCWQTRPLRHRCHLGRRPQWPDLQR